MTDLHQSALPQWHADSHDAVVHADHCARALHGLDCTAFCEDDESLNPPVISNGSNGASGTYLRAMADIEHED